MKIELIAIGDELLNGRVTDINAPYLAKFLHLRNLDLNYFSICQDSEESISEALKIAIERSDIILTTGGLGPTEDDRTKHVMAKIFNQRMIESSESEKITKENYKRFGREWKKGQNHYDLIPENFTPLVNHNGLAPGLLFNIENKDKKQWLLMAPGVPREFQVMLEKEFFPLITKEYNLKSIENDSLKERQIAIRTFGIPEEKIFGEIAPNLWDQLSQFGKVSSLPQRTGVNIIITLEGKENIDNYETILENVKNIINQTELKNKVWQYGNESLPEFIVKQFTNLNKTFAFAESCTGGLSSSKITDVPGSSKVFSGSFITYSNQLKENTLGVSIETLKKYGAVSEEVAKEMALGALQRSDSDIAISWSGIAGPEGGSEEKPVGTLALGWVIKGGEAQGQLIYSNGNRVYLKDRFSDLGLLKLLELIDY